jgi:aminoglycoside N3'-acetyltransferase
MLNRTDLVEQLRRVGVPASVPVMVHASLRRLGPIEGGADALLDALAEVIGPGGTLVFPLGSNDDVPFDPWRSPAEREIGALAEVFRRRPGTQVNDHPAGRFGACGVQARALLDPTPAHDYLGPGSLLDRFTGQGGFVLRLGADEDTVTLTHYAEYLAQVPNKRRVRRRYVRADGREQVVDSLDDSDGIVEGSDGGYFPQILIDFVAAGLARTGVVGGCTTEVLEAKAFVSFAVAWMEARL